MSSVEFSCVGPGDFDELYLDGPLIEVEITAPLAMVRYLRAASLPPFPVARGLAQIDTGAAVSAVDPSVFVSLEIPAVDSELIQTAHGVSALDRYNASVVFPQLSPDPLPLDTVLGGHILRPSERGAPIIMLIGRDLLKGMVFTYDGPNSRFSIAT